MKHSICTVVTGSDIAAIEAARPFTDIFEVRIDLVGPKWPEVARRLDKPWLACNRLAAEGGSWQGTEAQRKEELLKALQLGASIIDLELSTPNLAKMMDIIKKRARCLLSYHDFEKTPLAAELKSIVGRQLAAGADICKLVTTPHSVEQNLDLLRLYREFEGCGLIVFGMGQEGLLSRLLAPLAGAEFTYAAMEEGKTSAPGQLTAQQLTEIYQLLPL